MWAIRGLLAGALGLLAVLASWGWGSWAPFQPEVQSALDHFQVQATEVHDVSVSLDYTWTNPRTVADVSHYTTTRSGTARVVLLAADGTQVYSSLLTPDLDESSASGPPGDWTVRLILLDYSGTLDFRVQKP